MKWELIKAIVILPGTALVYVPGFLLWLHGWDLASWADARLWLAVVLGTVGGAMALWTMRLFIKVGHGTPAPWAPPKNLVIRGPYRHVRNPMLSAVLIVLGAEALVFGSVQVAGWMAVFFVLNTLYFKFSEEKGLEKRFGDDYRTYKAHVPRWLPRLKSWSPPLSPGEAP